MPLDTATVEHRSAKSPPFSATHTPQLDGIRGVAILLVLASHYLLFPETSVVASFPLIKLAGVGWIGVDLFFVLSGFLLGGILIDQKGTDGYFRRFYLRRAARMLPLYYVWLFACVFLGWAKPDWSYWVLAQNWTMAIARRMSSPALGISWSLGVEEQFYLVLTIV